MSQRLENDLIEAEAHVVEARQPGDDEAYARGDYWKKRYTAEIEAEVEEYDWYSHIRLADVMPSITQGLEAAAPLRDGEDGVALLHIGCGNSSWSAELAAQGVQVLSTDIDDTLVNHMKAKHSSTSIEWAVMDCSALPLPDNVVAVVLDKAVLDALVCQESQSLALDTICEAHRVLRRGGRFIVITASLTDPDIVTMLATAQEMRGGRWSWERIIVYQGKRRRLGYALTPIK